VDARLHLVAAEEALDPVPPVTPEGVAHVLDLLRRKFNIVFVDLPMPTPPEMSHVLRLARHVVVVLQPDLPSLRDAQVIRQKVTAAAGSDRVITVLNRADQRGALKRDLVLRGLGKAPDIVIPDLGPRMIEAVNMGTPALKHVPALRRHLLPLARELGGLRDDAVGRTRWPVRLLRRRAPA
jgi:pilus assembly protein CpaE